MKKFLLILWIVPCLGYLARAQQDPMLSQYMFNGLYLNPAYSGSHKYWSSTLTYRNQWVGFDGSPKTFIAAADGPLTNRNMGLGVIAMHDEIGVTKQNTLIANYAYTLKFNDKYKLAFGVNVGFSQFSAKLTDLTVWDNDEVFAENLSSKVLPRFGFGAYFHADRMYAGFSIPTLFAYENGRDFNFDLSRSTFLRRHFLLTGGYIFDLPRDVKLKPSVLLKYVQNAPLQADINLSAVYKNTYWLGASWRTGDALAIIVEYQTNTFFRVGYAYDITLSKLRNSSSGSHEIMIGSDFGRDLIKVKTPRYF
jgi:type IX secretion system PorP/SprF family membrane protein